MQELIGGMWWLGHGKTVSKPRVFRVRELLRGRAGRTLVRDPHDTRYRNLVRVPIANARDCNRDAADADHRIIFLLVPKACHATLQQRLS